MDDADEHHNPYITRLEKVRQEPKSLSARPEQGLEVLEVLHSQRREHIVLAQFLITQDNELEDGFGEVTEKGRSSLCGTCNAAL